jgi:hypothetical protein
MSFMNFASAWLSGLGSAFKASIVARRGAHGPPMLPTDFAGIAAAVILTRVAVATERNVLDNIILLIIGYYILAHNGESNKIKIVKLTPVY